MCTSLYANHTACTSINTIATLYACYQDALRTRIIRGQAFTCLNEDKRPREIGNLVTSTPRTPVPYNAEYAKFDE